MKLTIKGKLAGVIVIGIIVMLCTIVIVGIANMDKALNSRYHELFLRIKYGINALIHAKLKEMKSITVSLPPNLQSTIKGYRVSTVPGGKILSNGVSIKNDTLYLCVYKNNLEISTPLKNVLKKACKLFNIQSAVGVMNKSLPRYQYIYGENIKSLIHLNGLVKYHNKFYMVGHVPLLDNSGSPVGYFIYAQDCTKEVELYKSGIYSLVLVVFLLGLIVLGTTMFILFKSMKPLDELGNIVLSAGERNLKERMPIKEVSCTELVHVDEEECRKHSALSPCWSTFGKFSENPRCPIFKKGRNCTNCDVFKNSITDEVSIVSIWVNVLLDTIERYIVSAMEKMSKAMENVVPLSNNIVTVEEMADETRKMAAQVMAASEEMSSAISEIAHSATQASDRAQETMEIAKEGGKIIEESLTHSSRVQEVIELFSTETGKLTSSSKKIGEILGAIHDIAEQTNLLALNAAIEAARAGEAGRGFAVVADEVRRLSEKTQNSAKEIEEIVENIQKSIRYVAERSNEVKGSVLRQVEISNQTSEGFNTIMDSIERLVELVTNIASAVEEQSSATKQITDSIEETAHMSEMTKEELVKLSDTVNVLVSYLNKAVSLFLEFSLSKRNTAFVFAKMEHLKGIKRIFDCLISGTCNIELKDHTSCNFGKFYYSRGIKEFGDDPDFVALGDMHKEIHHYNSQILTKIKEGNIKEAREVFEELFIKVKAFLKQLDMLIEKYR